MRQKILQILKDEHNSMLDNYRYFKERNRLKAYKFRGIACELEYIIWRIERIKEEQLRLFRIEKVQNNRK